jgi:CRP-like cAMP-binding protein
MKKIDVALIRNLPLFSRLQEKDIADILPHFRLIDYDHAGITVFAEGEPGDALYLIIEGEVEIRKRIDSDDGSDKSLATLTAGAFFGEMALLTGETRSAAAVTHADKTQLLKILREEFLKMMTCKPEAAGLIMGGLVSILSERLRATSLEVVTLYETGRIISSTTSHYELCQRILERLVRTLGVKSGAVLLWNEIVECFECHAALPSLGGSLVFAAGSPLAGMIGGLDEPCRKGPIAASDEEKQIGLDCASVVYVPLITEHVDMRFGDERQKKVTGVIILADDRRDYFTLPTSDTAGRRCRAGQSGSCQQSAAAGKCFENGL